MAVFFSHPTLVQENGKPTCAYERGRGGMNFVVIF
jgi:hypothetical protein